MAIESVTANSGTGGASFATDQITGAVQVPYVKLMSGTDAAEDLIGGDATNGLDVDVTRVSGTVAVSNAGLTELAAAINGSSQMDINIAASNATLTVASHAVTNAGTFAVQVDGAALTALQLIDDAVFAEDVAAQAADKGVAVLAVRRDADTSLVGTDNDYANLQVDANGYLKVEVFDGGGTHTVDAPVGTPVFVRLSDGSSAISTLPVSMATNTPVGTVAHDSADSGAPVKVGAKAESSTAGVTLVADGDRTDLYADVDGLLITKNGTAWGDLISERVSNTDGASTAFSTFGATASARNMITAITVHNSHATTNGFVDIRDGTAGSVLWTIPLPATGGAVLTFDPPLRQPTANTALAYDVSAAITTVYISVNGFKSKA